MSRHGGIRGQRDSGPLDDRRSWSHVGGRVKTAHRLTPQFAHGRGLRLGTRNALSPSSTLSPCPPAARHDRAPGGPSQAPPGGRARGDDPRRRSEGRRAGENFGPRREDAGHGTGQNEAERQTTARGPDPSGRGNAENECRVRLRAPSRRRARRLRRGRRADEPQPLEQGPQALAPGVHPHQPPPAAAARTRKDVDAEHPAQQRRPPRRTLTRRSHRRRGPSSSASGRAGMTADRHAACGASTP